MIRKIVATLDSKLMGEKVIVDSISFINLGDEPVVSNVQTVSTIDEFIDKVTENGKNNSIYFHNLNIAGNFVLNWLMDSDQFEEAIDENGDLIRSHKIQNGQYSYTVSSRGEWYSISLKKNKSLITLHDSAKLLPFGLDEIREAFKINDKEDVIVLHKALNEMFKRGFTKTTIGSCCMAEFKKWCLFDEKELERWLPDLTKVACPIKGYDNADSYIREAYHGGWCYLKEGKANKIIKNGVTADVNGLYSAMMHSKSGNAFPVGRPTWFEGAIPSFLLGDKRYYFFVRVRTRFYIKSKHLPTIQIKGSPYYNNREWLKNSDYEGHKFVVDMDNRMVAVKPTLVLTMTDYEMLQKHYNLKELEVLDGCFFRADSNGLFDFYINKYAKQKAEAVNPVDRTIAKLMLNNLAGKFASSSESDYKKFSKDETGIYVEDVVAHTKKVGYIPIGAAITSYARAYTITAAQNNYDNFIYSDTDSIHCACSAAELNDIPEDDKELGYWKYETSWDEAVFVRSKCYVEHVTHKNLNAVEPYFDIRCSGMGTNAKDYVIAKLDNDADFDIRDFKPGLVIPGNIKVVSMNGGVTTQAFDFVIR